MLNSSCHFEAPELLLFIDLLSYYTGETHYTTSLDIPAILH